MKKKKGFAKIEFIANLEEIKALHKSGFNIKDVSQALA